MSISIKYVTYQRNTTHKFLVLAAVAYADIRLATLVENLEGEMLISD